MEDLFGKRGPPVLLREPRSNEISRPSRSYAAGASQTIGTSDLYMHTKKTGGAFAASPVSSSNRSLLYAQDAQPVLFSSCSFASCFEWETYMKWSQIYNSDIISLNVAGTSIIVLSSEQAANDLFEKRYSVYSDRARLPMANELMGWDFTLGFMKCGDR
ncbi:hypothetical protein DFH07DRAFT_462191 [Mycena maculata]|uniref:Uncharacterized protein n=1 Tax=Mycena maculata TaxID=230809 RepID=A0AAD7K9L1_9AGAR|nr:hypothetical protein DFH07DRAFT_462191 [Mycena maculata]